MALDEGGYLPSELETVFERNRLPDYKTNSVFQGFKIIAHNIKARGGFNSVFKVLFEKLPSVSFE